jgi:transcriptional regulator with XRE-family HTH domain
MVQHRNVDYIAIGKRVRDLRVKQDLSQEQLALKAEITSQYLSNIENAHAKGSLSTFLKIANALGSGVDALLCDNLADCRPVFEGQLATLLSDCNDYELKLVVAQAKGLIDELKSNT